MRLNKLIDTPATEKDFEWYMNLLDKSYDECVNLLKQKYGEVKHNYFSQKSYERFLNGEVKRISKGKYSRAIDGLECHHIYENEYIMLANQNVIKEYRYPYKLQKKENLVYCDICEHYILHILIMFETNGEFGGGGNEVYLRPKIEDWFIKKKVPKPEWMKECIRRVSLTSSQADELLTKGEEKLKEIRKKNREEYEKMLKMHSAKAKNMNLEEYEKYLEDEEQKKITLAKEHDLKLKKQFDKEYPNLKQYNITYNSPRKKLISALYNKKFKESYSTIKSFESAMIKVLRQDLIIMLNSI